jgi:hypothetical protein
VGKQAGKKKTGAVQTSVIIVACRRAASRLAENEGVGVRS